MGLLEEFIEEQRSRPAPKCTVERIREHLPEADREDLDRVLTERIGGSWAFTGATIARRLNKVLGEQALFIKGNTVQRHRNKQCSCDQ